MRTNKNDNFAEVCENCKFSRLERTTTRCHRDGPPFLPVKAYDWCNHWVAEAPKDIEYKEKYVAGVQGHDRAMVDAVLAKREREAETESLSVAEEE